MASTPPSNPRVPIRSAAAWRPGEIADPSEWTVVLTDEERGEIVAAVEAAVRAGATVSTVDIAAFPLPTLAERARAWSSSLNDGRGFLLLRRFPVDLLGPDDVELAYIGLGTHLGTPVGQDRDATVLGHVRDEGVERTHPGIRFYRTKERQDFHADGADLVGLLCLHRARTAAGTGWPRPRSAQCLRWASGCSSCRARRPTRSRLPESGGHWPSTNPASPKETSRVRDP